MYKTVLFDLDGTLLNTIETWLTPRTASVPPTAGRSMKLRSTAILWATASRSWWSVQPRKLPQPEQLAATLAEFDKVYGAHMHDKTAPYPGMPALLARLKAAGVRMAVFSEQGGRVCPRRGRAVL